MLQLRLIPIVIFAALCLLVLKTIGFMATDGRDPATISAAEDAPATLASTTDDVEITGATPAEKPSPAASAPGAQAALPKTPATPVGVSAAAPGGQSPAERALYERLQERRQELDGRARDMELRENLIKAAEQRLDGRIEELKELEGGKGSASAAR
ncbi:MAG: flagellar protein FlbB, partial [Xanthobacteraceae bacterium]|nr:flagellar protein FlbB [Xanthobacteraceae bacterium]